MPRIGQNPMRWVKDVHAPANITVTIIVHIPSLDAYFAESLDVLRLCLDSLRANTPLPFDLFIFDNGSCSLAREYLQEQFQAGHIQYLVFSQHNIGKAGAWNFLFSAAPGEYIAYSDSDVYFYPNWLEKSLEIFQAFPETGMVTAQPARRGLPKYCQTTLAEAEADAAIGLERGDLIPPAYIEACAYGLGRTLFEHQQIIAGQDDVKLTKGSIQAFASADHFQFVARRQPLEQMLPFNVSVPLGPQDDFQLDARMDELGYWRLSTYDYLVHHLGNHLPQTPAEQQLIFGGNVDIANTVIRENPQGQAKRFQDNRFIRRFLKHLNAWTYHLLYE